MARILRLQPTLAKSGMTRSPLYAAIAAGLWTRSVKLSGARAAGWPEHEVDALIDARIAGVTDSDIRVLVNRLHEARKSSASLADRSVRTAQLANTTAPVVGDCQSHADNSVKVVEKSARDGSRHLAESHRG